MVSERRWLRGRVGKGGRQDESVVHVRLVVQIWIGPRVLQPYLRIVQHSSYRKDPPIMDTFF